MLFLPQFMKCKQIIYSHKDCLISSNKLTLNTPILWNFDYKGIYMPINHYLKHNERLLF